MELRHIRYFLVVAEELHFSRAAERLNMCQPPLSQQIRQLEEELGVQLFRRTKRQVELTEAGRIFVLEARKILAQVDRAATIAVKAGSGHVGQLVVGTVTSVESRFHQAFVRILRTYAERYPGVHLELHRLSTAEQFRALRDGRIQVGFVTSAKPDEEVAVEVLERAPLVVALPERHRLTSWKVVPVREMAGEPHIVLPRRANPIYHDLLLSWCREQGFSLNIAHESDTMYMVLTLVALGFGVAILPASVREMSLTGVVFRSIRSPVPCVESGVAYRRNAHSNVLESFLGVVTETAGPKRARAAAVTRKGPPEDGEARDH